MRNQLRNVQTLENNQSVWLVYQNDVATNYKFDCSSKTNGLISPFDKNTTVKNLLSPYDEIELKKGPVKLGIDGSEDFNGCVDELDLDAYAFRAYVPKSAWLPPVPTITKFLPGHDARILPKGGKDGKESLEIEFQFSEEMDCDWITRSIFINSTTVDISTPELDNSTVTCSEITNPEKPLYVGGVSSVWKWHGTLVNVSNGIHAISIQEAATSDQERTTLSTDRFLLRIGREDNPLIFPRLANYTQEVLFKDSKSGDLFVSHNAAGADKWRYSLNWESTWSDWEDYKGGNSTLTKQPWSGTSRQKWSGDHVVLQYWSRLAGSSSTIQHADRSDQKKYPRRFPHLFAHGAFNEFGFDGGLNNAFRLAKDGKWNFHFMTEWPAKMQVNVWGMNPDGQPDATIVFGDIDNNGVLDRMVPDSLGETVVNFTDLPPSPYLAYRMELDDGIFAFRKIPIGSRYQQVIVYALLWSIPFATGMVSIWAYMGFFYSVKFNKIGITRKLGGLPFAFRRKFEKLNDADEEDMVMHSMPSSPATPPVLGPAIAVTGAKRRTVLIATMEYDIEDWAIKIKIGGLGVMAQLMGKSLAHQDLIWVVPCVGGVDYPVDQVSEPMDIKVLDNQYEIQVQYHELRNITYVLLDAPIFRQQSKAEPYPPR
jgi:alpha-1,3-glucan synthase